KYGKFAYDTRFAFHVAISTNEIHEAAPDSMLAFYIGGYVYVRRVCEKFQVSDSEVTSEWSPYPGIRVETTIMPTEEGHIRKHIIISEIECSAYDCGFGVEIDVNGVKLTEDKSMAQVENEYSMCCVTTLCGTGEGTVIVADPNTNLLHPMTRIPAICYQLAKGKNEIVTEVKAQYNRE
ncbi:MAG: hypothetical protein K0R34_3891, partial [Herbinix sp.]|nr:hypothetical protein [Herbinix sp.]